MELARRQSSIAVVTDIKQRNKSEEYFFVVVDFSLSISNTRISSIMYAHISPQMTAYTDREKRSKAKVHVSCRSTSSYGVAAGANLRGHHGNVS